MLFAFFGVLGLELGLASFPTFGQNVLAQESPSRLSSLRQLNRNSGYILDGTVLSVHPVAPNTSGVATAQITFRVEQAIRGTRSGQVLTIREWAACGTPANAIAREKDSCCFFTVRASRRLCSGRLQSLDFDFNRSSLGGESRPADRRCERRQRERPTAPDQATSSS
jgi:hypothetical protein